MPLINNNIEGFTKKAEGLSCVTAIKNGSQISLLKRSDEAFVKTAIRLLVEDVLMHYGVLERVSSKRLTDSILGRYWWMKIEEIAYVFNKGKNGGYQKHYGVVSESLLLEWLKTYDCEEREYVMMEENKRMQEETNKAQILSDDQLKDFYKNNVGVDNSESVPDGSERISKRKLTPEEQSEYNNYKMKYSADPETQKLREDILKKLDSK